MKARCMLVLNSITYSTWNDELVEQIESKFQESLDVLKWSYEVYHNDEIVYACSFGAEAIVLIDLLYKVKKNAKLIFLDTSLHFQETYDVIDRVKNRYPELCIEMVQPEISLTEQNEKYGDRKSTRLNSSHVAISYAVICLKKTRNSLHCDSKFNS